MINSRRPIKLIHLCTSPQYLFHRNVFRNIRVNMDFLHPSAPHVCQISKTYFNWKTGTKGVHFLTAIWDTWWRSTFVKCRADFRLAPSQWETSLQGNAVSNLLDANLESALKWLVVVASGVSDPGMHHGTCVTHVPWCMSGSLYSLVIPRWCNTLVPGLNGLHFTDDIFNILSWMKIFVFWQKFLRK